MKPTCFKKQWQQMTVIGSEWQWYNEWKRQSALQRMGEIFSATKTDELLPGIDGCN